MLRNLLSRFNVKTSRWKKEKKKKRKKRRVKYWACYDDSQTRGAVLKILVHSSCDLLFAKLSRIISFHCVVVSVKLTRLKTREYLIEYRYYSNKYLYFSCHFLFSFFLGNFLYDEERFEGGFLQLAICSNVFFVY